ncbi:Tannase/feruloyl esterase [Stachybotrys elegans]|uniref:Carboxylic ester hydrolase n=1 Tax=Stachybotrys elegans TaxID=80388 RepID=A0A8K0SF40_9HYPO|nr:Tannase/feruloyl esterase [Stachybotrys elegans]
MRSSHFYFVILAAAGPVRALNCKPRAEECTAETFASDGIVVESASHEAIGTLIPLPDTVASCGGPSLQANITASLCRVVVNVATSDSSSVRIEAWLPDQWNNRFLATGGGGIGGCIDYETMQNGAFMGFAAFGTNGGHDGSAGHDFFLGHPEVINDFGHRSIHIEAEAGKKMVRKYYNQKDFKSYYQGCSTGGRQGFQTAQMFPDDFDGILVGAPAVDWLRIVASKAVLAGRIGWPNFDSQAYVRPEQWPAIVAKQIELFDALDGVKDGIIDNPTDFRFDASLLACGTGILNNSLCLTGEQVLSVNKAYEPLADTTGRIVYPPFEIGSNTAVFSQNQMNGTELAYRVLDDFWRGAVYNDSNWSSLNWDDSQMDFAVHLNPGGVGFKDPDFTQYHARGGKILAYHGRSDQTVTSKLSSEYFAEIQAALNFSTEEMHSFYNLFFIPGHEHCRNGPGAWNFGQAGVVDPDRLDPVNNALMALTEWVEKGSPPTVLVGAKYVNDDHTQGIEAERMHCPYPLRSVWNGKDDPKRRDSWTCQSPFD